MRDFVPRIPPLEPPYSEATAEALSRMMPKGVPVPPLALFRTLARQLPLAERMMALGRYLLRAREPAISPRVRELVIQRVCAHLGCSYEWGVHVAGFASANGIDEAQVAILASGADADDRFSELEQRVLAFVDGLLKDGSVEDAVWARASEHYDDDRLLELTVLVGWYHVIAFVANALHVAPESWAPSLSQRQRS